MSLGGIFNETCAGCGAVIGLIAAKLHHAYHAWEYEMLRSLAKPDGYDPAALLNATAVYDRAREEYAAEQEKIRRKVEGIQDMRRRA
jgi:hypothetical protein